MRGFFARWISAALLTLLVTLTVVLSEAAWASTIINVARADWSFGETRGATLSNSVVLDVERAASTLKAFGIAAQSSQTLRVPQDQCAWADGSSAATAVPVRPISQIRPGEDVILQLIEPAANRDPAAIDTIELVTVTGTSSRQTLTVAETGPNTGEFTIRLGTSAAPQSSGNCTLHVQEGASLQLDAMLPGAQTPLSSAQLDVLADPYGTVFDSTTGLPVSGAKVTLIDDATGQPPKVFGDDRTTPWPSSVVTGEPIIDGAGTFHHQEAGQYRFPLAAIGRYRLVVEPPAPYSAPSTAQPEQLARLIAPNGAAFVIVPGSFGAAFLLTDAIPVRVDIPLDRPTAAPDIARTASRERAQPGDVVFHTIRLRNPDGINPTAFLTLSEAIPAVMRLRRETIRLNGVDITQGLAITPDGSRLELALGALAPGQSVQLTFATEVRPDAQAGRAMHRAEVPTRSATPLSATTVVVVERDAIAGRMTLIGRVSAGHCTTAEGDAGIAGVRLMLEDGSFAITDNEGRYHFEGLVPGTHVVQLARSTLPQDATLADCSGATRNAGNPASRFVIGQGGSLLVANFSVIMPKGWTSPVTAQPAASSPSPRPPVPTAAGSVGATEAQAAAGARDWLALGDGPDGWLFPQADHNPRAPAIRVAIRHRRGQTVKLMVDGKPVDPLTFDGTLSTKTAPYAVSVWRGIALNGETTRLTAEVINTLGGVSATLVRDVHFSSRPAKIELVREKSLLVADGKTRPVLALRVLDPAGRPLRDGMSGAFTINAPHETIGQIEQQQQRQASAIGQTGARWRIDGDDGMALIELVPTMVSGGVRLSFELGEGELARRQDLETWLSPGDVEWTIVGLAEGSVGAKTVADAMQRGQAPSSDLGKNARVALYAKGRVLGKYLMTLAYDSAKQPDDQPVLGTIDPSAYYTVFADASSRRFDAASREKLYVRIESATFRALYGDFRTNFDQTRLARYTRTATGVSAQARLGAVQAEAFAVNVASRFARDEIQGAGITGPYALRSRAIIVNTDRVTIETRDRFRSEIVLDRRAMSRFADYDVDLLAGTIRFRQPVASRDADLNPQIIVVEYEVDAQSGGELNAGVRATLQTKDQRLRVGMTAVTDKGEGPRTNMGAADAHYMVAEHIELSAELAFSQSDGDTAKGWTVAVEHRTESTELRAYAQSVDADFGLGQQSGAEIGRRKFGLDARTRIGNDLTASLSAWQDESLADASHRRALQLEAGYRTTLSDLRLGLSHFGDVTADGRRLSSTVAEAGITRRLFDNRLEISASTAAPLEQAQSLDLPVRHQLSGRFAITPDVRINALYELAKGQTFDTRSVRAGVEITPWQGMRLSTDLGNRQSATAGASTFAAFGLSQALQVTSDLTFDATLESSRTISGTAPVADAINAAQPPSSGLQLSVDQTVFEDFTAITLGGTYRRDRWTGMARIEMRDGQLADRYGLSLGAIRQLGEGSMVGSGLTWARTVDGTGGFTQVIDAALAFAHRPAGSVFAVLGKLEYRSDEMSGTLAGLDLAFSGLDPGRTALLSGNNALSRRLLASLSANWTPRGNSLDQTGDRAAEIALFLAGRYSFDQYDGLGIRSFAMLGGLDGHISLTRALEVGGIGTVRSNLTSGATEYAYGPTVGLVPGNGVLLTLGYNVAGFRDPDYSALRKVEQGAYVSLRMKLDADSFGLLGLNGRKQP